MHFRNLPSWHATLRNQSERDPREHR